MKETAAPQIVAEDSSFMTTDYHARIWAWSLTRQTSIPTYETLAGSIMEPKST